MLKKLFPRLLALLLVSALGACSGGGAFETSTDTTTDGSSSSGGDTTSTVVSEVVITGQQIIPLNETVFIDVQTVSSSGGSVGNSALVISATGSTSLGSVPSATDVSGNASFSVTNKNAETVTLTISSGDITTTQNLYFGAAVVASVDKSTMNANGQDSATLVLRATTSAGVGIAGVPVTLAFSSNSFATAATSTGTTDAGGTFTTTITDTVAETIQVTPSAGGLSANSLTLNFVATSDVQTPDKVDLTVVGNNVTADGTATATLQVVARDASNTPIASIPVSLAINSGSAILGAASGTTGDNGVFQTTISDTVIEQVQVTATAGGVASESKLVNFISSDSSALVSKVNIAISGSASVQADGTQTVTVIATALDSSGNPVAGVDANIAVNSGSATITPETGTTDSSGRFIATIKDTFVESFRVRANVGGVYSAYSNLISFTTAPGSETTIPGSVELVVSPSSGAISDGEDTVTITAVVRDSSGTPMSGVPVSFSTQTVSSPSNAGSALLAAATGDTGAGGSFSTTMTNTVSGTLLLTATARGVTASSNITFSPKPSQTPATLVVSVVNNGQPANGEDATTLTAIVRDSSGSPVEGARVSLVFGQNEAGSASAAVPNQSNGLTDAGGSVQFKITDTIAETFSITLGVNTGSASPQTVALTFKANASSGTPPAKVTATVNRTTAPADGETAVTLTVIARDASNTPLSGVAISLSSGSGSALLSPASGTTGDNGALVVSITNTQAEVVSITPVATSGNISGNPVDITFTESTTTVPSRVEIQVSNNGAAANGTAAITLTVLVTDAVGRPLAERAVTLASQPTTALFNATTGASGTTNANGTFVTSMTSTTAGTYSITPTADGISGATVDITFSEPTADSAATMQLLTSSTQLSSAGSTDGVVITALLRTKGNNPFSGAEVTFSADSGLIQALDVSGNPAAVATTNDSGQAQARLTTVGNPVNRTITVVAVSGELREEITVDVVGSDITIDGPSTGTLGGTMTFTISLKDSAGNGISGQAITLATTQGNAIASTTPAANGAGAILTDASGKVSVIVNASVSGDDQLTAAANGVSAVAHSFSVSGDNFTVTREGTCVTNHGANGDVSLNETCNYVVHWDNAGNNVVAQALNISATRGTVTLLSNPPVPSGTTDANGDMRFSIAADNAGPTTITVSSTNGPSAQVSFDFIANAPHSITLQANPSTVGVNSGTSETERSEIVAVVRDAQNNLVKGVRVEFTLTDVTGGKINPSAATTDRYGQASTVYIAGGSSSASGDTSQGVSIVARIPGTTSATCSNGLLCPQVTLTVAKRGVYITLGTGKTINLPDDARYSKTYSVLVNDVNGVAVADAEIALSIIPKLYYEPAVTGEECQDTGATDIPETVSVGYCRHYNASGQFVIWGAEPKRGKTSVCSNEDVNRNGVLDTGEDANNNGFLEPGNVASVPDTVTTDSTGFATFDVTYARTYADWVQVELTARAVVSGTEDTEKSVFVLDGAVSDYVTNTSPPPAAPDWVCP